MCTSITALKKTAQYRKCIYVSTTVYVNVYVPACLLIENVQTVLTTMLTWFHTPE